jgi:hypothetical protein
MKTATAAGPAVRTVVDADGASTALAIAALVASLISFGVVLMSVLQKETYVISQHRHIDPG